jgi:hypothetical protein
LTESKDSSPCLSIDDQKIGHDYDHKIHIKETKVDIVDQVPFDEDKRKGSKPEQEIHD